MKKILLLVVAIIAVVFLYNQCGGDEVGNGSNIDGYQGTIESADGNIVKLANGLSVQMIGVAPDHSEAGIFVTSKYLNQQVRLIADSRQQKTFLSTDETVPAYIILENEPGAPCLNKLVLNEYPQFIDVTLLSDSIQWAENNRCDHSAANAKTNLALYMKQRSFLISVGNSIGTGFFINETGLALTNWHVLAPNQASEAEAYLYQEAPDDSQIYSSRRRGIKNVLWSSALPNGMDVSIFQVDLQPGETVPYFNLVDRHIAQGDKCSIFGNPKGLYASYNSGYISAYRPDRDRPNVNLVQYDMATNGGNSGGPVCAQCGCIVAVHELGDKSGQNLNFGVDILDVRQVLDSQGLKYGGK